jgi:succinate dehydrogenase / fumarate reductase flavoprotein subunit
LVFGKRAGYYAACFAKKNGAGRIDEAEVKQVSAAALRPFESRNGAEGPYRIQSDLQKRMQELVGIVRTQREMQSALDEIGRFRERAAHVSVEGNREYNNGWHTALDLSNLLTVSEAVTRAALLREESRGAHFRDDHPDKKAALGKVNFVVSKGSAGEMRVVPQAIPEVPAELKQVIEEMK